jgi:acyl transferase domain-containing protein
VRFATAVQAALEDGHRVFGEPAPHPLLTRAVEQTALSAGISVQAVAAMRREQPLPYGLRVFLADLHNAGSAVDFATMYPSGKLVDAPLPTWTHRHYLLESDDRDSPARGACTASVHPLLGEHVRLPEEPERHAWQADVGTAKLPWLSDHRVNDVAAYPGAAYCEMALAAAELVFGEGSDVRDVIFEKLMLLDAHTEATSVATVERAGVAEFAVETDQDGERVRQAVATLTAVDDPSAPAVQDIDGLLAAHPNRISGEEVRQWFASRRIQFGPAFAGLIAVHTETGDGGSSVLAEIALPGDIRAQQAGYGIHPALLDACFQSAAAALGADARTEGGLLLPLSVGRLRRLSSGRDARYCLVRVHSADAAAIDVDLDLLNANGDVVLQAANLRMGTQDSKSGARDRVLAERLLAVEWDRQEPPTAADTDAGEWLLVAPDGRDEVATDLSAALTDLGASCRTLQAAEVSAGQLDTGAVRGVVVLTAPPVGDPDEECVAHGRDVVAWLVGIARELPNTNGEPPRLFVLTHGAQAVTQGDQINLDDGAVSGLLRVIGAEHPSLRPTQIDVDAKTPVVAVANQLLSASDEDTTAWRAGDWYTARLRQSALRPDERRTTTVDADHDGMRLDIRTPGDLDTLEFVTADRQPPQAGQIEVAVSASSVNFADVLLAFGRYHSVDGPRPGLGIDLAGVVTAVGAGVTDFQVGDRVGAIADAVAWGTFVT